MADTGFRTTQSWQQAIELGPYLVSLAEELPASEQMGLSAQLQAAMVDLPTAIALDLHTDGRNTRLQAALRLIATLEIIEKVYPALDTAQARAAVDQVYDLVTSESFDEPESGSVVVPAVPVVPVVPAPVTPAAAPEAAPAPTSIPITEPAEPETGENHVQSDSVQ